MWLLKRDRVRKTSIVGVGPVVEQRELAMGHVVGDELHFLCGSCDGGGFSCEHNHVEQDGVEVGHQAASIFCAKLVDTRERA